VRSFAASRLRVRQKRWGSLRSPPTYVPLIRKTLGFASLTANLRPSNPQNVGVRFAHRQPTSP